MRKFTKQELERLTQLATSDGRMESRFKTAMGANRDGRNGYVRGLTKTEASEIFRIFKDATGTNLRFYPNCGICVLHMLQAVAPKYYADLDELEKEEAAKATEEPKPKTPRKRAKK